MRNFLDIVEEIEKNKKVIDVNLTKNKEISSPIDYLIYRQNSDNLFGFLISNNMASIKNNGKISNNLYFSHAPLNLIKSNAAKCSIKQLNYVQEKINNGIDLEFEYSFNTFNKNKITLLGYAILNKDYDLINLLAKNKVELYHPFVVSNTQYTPIEYIQLSYTESEAKRVYDILDSNGYTVYEQFGTTKENENALKLLELESKDDVLEFIKNNPINFYKLGHGASVLELILEKYNSTEVLLAILGKDVDINFPMSDGSHVLTKIKLPKDAKHLTPFMDKMIELGLDVNYQNKQNGETLLFHACHLPNACLFHYLIDKNANYAIADWKGKDLWMYAKNKECVSIGISKRLENIYPYEQSIHKLTNKISEICSSKEKYIKTTVEQLLTHGIYENYLSTNACVVLNSIYAEEIFSTGVQIPQKQLIEERLLKNPNKIIDSEKNSTLNVVIRKGLYDKVELLLKSGADPNRYSDSTITNDNPIGYFPLELALITRNKPIATLLCQYGAKVHQFYLSQEFRDTYKPNNEMISFINHLAKTYGKNEISLKTQENAFEKGIISQEDAEKQVDDVFNKVMKDFEDLIR